MDSDSDKYRPLNFTRTATLDVNEFVTPALMAQLSEAKSDKEFFKAVYCSILRSNKMPYNRSSTFPETKSVEWSRHLRLEGNKECPHNPDSALLYYTRAIAAAPYPKADNGYPLEMALAYGNRSAIYFENKKIKYALRDIKLAFFFRYPDNLSYKLHERRTKCFRALGMVEEAITSCKEAIASVDHMTEPPPGKKSLLKYALERLCIQNSGDCPPHLLETKLLPPPKPFYGYHSGMGLNLNCLQVHYNQRDLYHTVCQRNVKPGDILSIQQPYEALLFPDHHFTHCYYCFDRADAMFPCQKCALVVFCSLTCRQLAWKEFHRFQCPLLLIVNDYSDYYPSFALKLLLTTVNRCMNDSLRKLSRMTRALDRLMKKKAEDNEIVMPGEPPSESSKDPAANVMDFAGIYNMNRTFAPIEESMYPVYVGDDRNPRDVRAGDLFLYALNAVILVNCLSTFTDFFTREVDDSMSMLDKKIEVGGLLLRFMQIIYHNSHAVDGKRYDEATDSFTLEQTGIGIYYTLGFQRHSCCNNASLIYINGTKALLYANQPIMKDQEVTFNVGAHYSLRNLTERFLFLKELKIKCECQACDEDWPTGLEMNLQSRMPPLKLCPHCQIPREVSSNESVAHCPKCGVTTDISSIYNLCSSVLQERFQLWAREIHDGKSLSAKKHYRKELACVLEQLMEAYKMPNIFVLHYQSLLHEHFMKLSISTGPRPVKPPE